MQKNLLTLLNLIVFIAWAQAQNVPNGGFETWASGNPANWLVNNIPTIATPITQATPAHGGALALKGEVVSSSFGDIAPLVASTDMSGNGFTITQAYSTFSFYYKTNLSVNVTFDAGVFFYDASSQVVAAGNVEVGSSIGSYTLASVPITYFGTNPVEAVITFVLNDSTGGSPPLGNYFIVDDVALTGLASVQQIATSLSISNVYPNPAHHSAIVHYNMPAKSFVQFQVLNMQGKIVSEVRLPEQAAGKHEKEIDVTTIPMGFYILRMRTSEGISFARLQVVR